MTTAPIPEYEPATTVTDPDPRLHRWFNRPPTTISDPAILQAVQWLIETVSTEPVEALLSTEPTPVLTLVEEEREVTQSLDTLRHRLQRDRVPDNPEALQDAMWRWFQDRPVTDAEALTKGIAVLGWGDDQQRLSWKVAVVRPTGHPAHWVPAFRTSRQQVADTRAAAMTRSQRLTATASTNGEVTVWAYPFNPRLSTAALSNPAALATRAPLDHLCAVVTPGRPVAITTRHAATRLTAETNEQHATVPLDSLHTIGWA